jgi:hypothetical protein
MAHSSENPDSTPATDQTREVEPRESGLVGLMADEPDIVDQIIDDIYRTRETQTLRVGLRSLW